MPYRVVPTTYIIEKNGQQSFRYIGSFTWDSKDMIKGLEELIKKE